MKWLSAKPLKGYSSLHEGVLSNLPFLKMGHFSSVISCNIESELPPESTHASTIIHTRPLNYPQIVPRVDFCINHLEQWELDLTSFKTFDDYLDHLDAKKRYNYFRTEKHFAEYGCTISVIEGDWSEYAEKAYELYHHVATKYMQIYDLSYFQSIAKLPDYKLICCWFGDKLIGSLVLAKENSIAHSMLCGLDYAHSKKSFTYSKLHYEFIRQAIASGNYKMVNSGVTANQAKGILGMSSKPAVVEIYVQNPLLAGLLRFSRSFLAVTINEKNEVCVKLRWPGQSRD